MSDIKRECPVCKSWTSSVGIAVRDGDPCPYCGAPAELILRIDALRESHADVKLREELEAALIELSEVKADRDRLAATLSRARRAFAEATDDLDTVGE